MVFPIQSMGTMAAHAVRTILDGEFLEKSRAVHPQISEIKRQIGSQFAGFSFGNSSVHRSSWKRRRASWRIGLALDTGGAPDAGGEEEVGGDGPEIGRTRLGTIVRAAANQFLGKLNSTRKNFPTKIFLLLLGFYTANALATILGQTGDWDVLVAGVVVAAIEGIGMLVYGGSSSARRRKAGRTQALIEMLNFWKAGVCLGLFVDAFKLGS